MDALKIISVKSYSIGMYEKSVPEEIAFSDMLHLGKEAGYDFFEISIDRTEKRIGRLFDLNFQKELSSAISETGMSVGSMCLSALGTYTLGNEDPLIVNKAVDIFMKAVDFANKFGIRIIQIPGCDVPKGGNHTEKTDSRFIHNLRLLVEYASTHAVMIGLENMEDEYMDNVRKSLRLIHEINSPYFQLYSDAGNITAAADLYSDDPTKDLGRGADHLIALHLKETRPGKYGGLFYGEGNVDFQRMVSDAWHIGIRRFVLEYWYTGNNGWKSDLVNARKMCEKWISVAAGENNRYETV